MMLMWADAFTIIWRDGRAARMGRLKRTLKIRYPNSLLDHRQYSAPKTISLREMDYETD